MAKKKSSPEAKAAAAAAVASSPTAIATSPVMELKTSPAAAVDNRTSLNAAAAASRTGGNNGGNGDDSAAASNAATAAAASIREVVWSHPIFFLRTCRCRPPLGPGWPFNYSSPRSTWNRHRQSSFVRTLAHRVFLLSLERLSAPPYFIGTLCII